MNWREALARFETMPINYLGKVSPQVYAHVKAMAEQEAAEERHIACGLLEAEWFVNSNPPSETIWFAP